MRAELGKPTTWVWSNDLPPCCHKLATSPPDGWATSGRHLNAFPLRIKHRGAGQESTRSVSEKTRSDNPPPPPLPPTRGREKGKHRSRQRWTFFDFSFKTKKTFSSSRFQEQAGGGRGGGFCSRRWSVMSHERVIKGSPVRSAGFLCATAAGRRAVGRASGDRERQAAEARDSCAGMVARDAGAVGRAGGVPAGVRESSGARGRGPGPTQVG